MGLRAGSLFVVPMVCLHFLVWEGCGEARSATPEVRSAPSHIYAHPQQPETQAGSARASGESAKALELAATEHQSGVPDRFRGHPSPRPGSEPIDQWNAEAVSWLVERAIAHGDLPGCVVAAGNKDQLLYLQAFGERTAGEPMTVDTRFDLASVTKAVATSTSVMALVEQGALDVDAPVWRYLHEFKTPQKLHVTLRELLTHTSGLPKVSPLADFAEGHDHALREIARMHLTHAPGSHFDYSDLGFITLGELVARTSGMTLDAFAKARVFAPLGMTDTLFSPPLADAARTAPTEERDDQVIRGVVDDPRAFRLGGVAGHAGLFSTASDLARYARMLLNKGELDGQRVLSEDTVAKFLEPRQAAEVKRALGWDVQSSYALGRGLTMSASAVGHGGYTGTSFWIDPEQDFFVVFLSNRVHMGEQGVIHPLASSIADILARARREHDTSHVRAGIDVLEDEGFARLRGRNIALLTHAAARDREGQRTLDRLLTAPQVHVRTLLAPEHGFEANREGHVEHTQMGDIPLYSLFGKTKRPDHKMLSNVDTVVIDLVDVGARFYTYMSTVMATLEVANELGLEVMLLDRPNPIDGTHVEGPMSEPAFASFVNYHPLPLRHGMTAGELAGFLAHARGLNLRVHVVRVENWKRDAWLGDTDLAWHPPSPNLRTKEQAMLYPAVALVEGTNVSVGRGTEQAFAVVGAPFVKGDLLAAELARDGLSGLAVSATRFRPTIGPYAGTRIEGVQFELRDAHAFSAARTGLSLIRALMKLYRSEWDTSRLDRLVAHQQTLKLLFGDTPVPQIEDTWQSDLFAFQASRKQALLY